jgi:ketosteroid isomerase-like protein
MKITILALTAFVLATAPLAWAQEDTETPAPTPEAAAPDTSSSSANDPSVSVTTEKSPEPEKRSSPAATRSSSPAGPTKTTSPAKTSSTAPSTKAAPPAAVMPTKKSTPEATLREIENKWEASIMARDPSVAQAYLADDYRGVGSTGKVKNKSTVLSEIKKDTDTYTSTKNGNMDVRVYGGKFAVVMGTSTEAGKAKDGKAFKRNYRWTDTWVERNGNWQCVASQAMLLSK